MTRGADAGEVFHEFAIFCDTQLQNPDSREELVKAQKLRDRRQDEIDAYNKMKDKPRSTTERSRFARQYDKAKKWQGLENAEYDRLYEQRETFLRMSLQNYLLSLAATDKHDEDVLRLVALWLEFADSILTNTVVKQFLPKVPSHKFARVMNQLASRQQDETSEFQRSLANLIFRVCKDHPYHGLYQLYSNSTPPNLQDEASKSRQSSAIKIVRHLEKDKEAAPYWNKVKRAHDLYDRVAMFRNRELVADSQYDLESIPVGGDMASKIPKLNIPPPTMAIGLRSDRNYQNLPGITRFRTKMKIASGISAPKIITAIASDGRHFQQLVCLIVNGVLQY